METVASSAEITVLGWSVVLLLVQIFAQASTLRDLGTHYLAGPRDEPREPKNVLAGRLKRALHNFLETYPAFIALALALAVTGKTGGLGASGAWIWLIARAVYVVTYAAGIPMLRSIVWLVSLAGLIMMLIGLMA
ncbi:MAG: MAPEG family protein [Rhizobiaceae bacterium]|nr:MAPEG family protein [Rhizobiaceae bacterium]